MSESRVLRLLALAVLGGVLAALVPAQAASAHTTSGASATNYRTTLHAVSPQLEGVRLRVVEAGNRLELRNTSDVDVVVLGYQNEPYLRVGPSGTYANTRSPALYLNRSFKGNNEAVPSDADPTQPPQWDKQSDDDVVSWHDHRVHWMNDVAPPIVRADPGRSHVLIPEWQVDLSAGDVAVKATGDLTWVPGPSSLPWWVLAGALLAGMGALLLVERPARWLACTTGALILVDVVHTSGTALATSGAPLTRLSSVLESGLPFLVAWVVGAYGLRLLWGEREEGLWFVVFTGALVAVLGGVADVSVLDRSQLPFAFSPVLARSSVAVSMGLGCGIVLVSAVQLRRQRSRSLDVGPPDLPVDRY